LPIYDLSAVAHAIDLTPKQLDNLLSRNAIDGVERKRRGVTRRISPEAAVTIEIAWRLSEGTQIPIAAALDISQRLAVAPEHRVGLGEFLSIAVEFGALRANTLERLDAAVEAVGRRRRGRPPSAKRRAPSGDA